MSIGFDYHELPPVLFHWLFIQGFYLVTCQGAVIDANLIYQAIERIPRVTELANVNISGIHA